MSLKNFSPNLLPFAGYEINTSDDLTLETISLTLFVAGCQRRCQNCQNPELQKVKVGENCELVELEWVKNLIREKSILVGSIVFCGGDWMPFYAIQLKELVEFCKKCGLRTILYTGETFENLDSWIKENVWMIIDGEYREDMKVIGKSPSSLNQRVFVNGVEMCRDDLKINL